MGPNFSLVVGVLLVALAVVCLAPALEIEGSSAKKVMKKRIQAMQVKPVDGSGAPRKQLAAKHPELGPLRMIATRSAVTRIERHLALAGLGADRLPLVVLFKVLTPALVLLLTPVVTSADKPMFWLIFFVALGISYFAPDIIVHGRAEERQKRMMYDLPDVLDQMTISIEAGMGFESAMARVGANNSGPLGEEIVRTVQDMTLGMARRDAYLALASRNNVEDLRRFTKSIIQAEEFGVPISQVVRVQAEEMRDKRRQRARETAQKVPVKLLFPMLTCVMPVLFIVILTPAFLAMGKSL
ncbi:tight adherence protein C [Aeromicrobium panaciterrae]|uniref:Tight adherence protein C n=1 Tax=Aeromicrobium panaciterrae TaxID=363861 RepID=A0ABU1ULL1_9ACTN|nr:type II secretion system F family protein [Aeromicrobium panaciterrae]MDR7086076.1 tight adherence protein C [Aeromicrobium panaciterrae]